MKLKFFTRREGRVRQGVLEFVERRLRHERWFKRAIVLATFLVIAVILRVVPYGVYLWEEFSASARRRAAVDRNSARGPTPMNPGSGIASGESTRRGRDSSACMPTPTRQRNGC